MLKISIHHFVIILLCNETLSFYVDTLHNAIINWAARFMLMGSIVMETMVLILNKVPYIITFIAT